MHQLVPHFILQQMNQGNLQGEFSTAAVFLDLSGFTNLTDILLQHDQHGAEVLATVIKTIFDPLVRHVYQQGGFIATFAGDAFLALFPGYPLLKTNSQQPQPPAPGDTFLDLGCANALAAAWRMQQHIAAHTTHNTPYGSFDVTAKIGLASGRVNWGILSSSDDSQAAYYFQGSAVEDSAAAEHMASRHEIILTAEAYRKLAGSLAAEPLAGYFRLKEITAPLTLPQPIDLPPANLELLERFFPREVIRQRRSGEFRQVVCMFISFPTIRSEAQLELFSQSVLELAWQFGGLFYRLDFGDKGAHLAIFWGMPITHENDIERALSCILTLQNRTSISITAGITYRIAYAGFSGSSLREEYTAYGRGINLAARFMTAAPRGEIWVDEEVARRAQQQFDIEFEGELAFKGFTQKQKVYVLFERKDAVELSEHLPLLGRRRELQQLAHFIEPLSNGHAAGSLILWGEAGSGKSRLIAALLQEQQEKQEQAIQAFLCQADQILRQSLNPFRYWLRHYFAQSTGSSVARNKHSFNRKLDNLLAKTAEKLLVQELDRTRSCLGALLDLHWPDSLYAQLDPQGRFENTLTALTMLLRAESLRKPVLLILEDAHWLDADSRLYLQRLARSLTVAENVRYPLAIMITARTEQPDPILDDTSLYQNMELGLLSATSLRTLAGAILQGTVGPSLQKLLVERTDGNPFFAEQIVRYLQEQELVTATAAGWDVTAQHAGLLPADVRTLLVARIDQLAADVKQGVERAAVLGREFDLRLLSMMLAENAGMTSMLQKGEQATIWSALSQLRYIFRHTLLRDAAYRMQLRSRRQELHRLAVQALTELFAADLSPYYGELAHHAEQAGLTGQARRYLQLAGDGARDDYHNSQAVDYYSRALALTPVSDLNRRYTLLFKREAVYDLQGDRQNQARDLAALAELAVQLQQSTLQTDVSLRRGEYALNTGAYAEAIAAARDTISLARTAQDLPREAAGHRQWGTALRLQGAYVAARAQLRRATEKAQTTTAGQVWAHSVKDLGLVAYYQGDYAAARSYLEKALAINSRRGDRRGESLCLQNLALVAMDMADYDAARVDSNQALAICRDIGDQRGESLCLNNLASIARREYDFSAAQNYYERSLVIYHAVNDRRGQAMCLNNLGLIACDIGHYAAAQPHLQKALQLYQDIGDREGAGVCLNNLGIMAHDLQDYHLARDYLLQGLAICRKIGFRTVEGTILNELGLVESDLGYLDRATASLQQAMDLRSELGQYYYVVEDQAGLALVNLLQDRLGEALAYIGEVLAYLENDPNLSGAERPLNVHMICYQVLSAAHDKQAAPVLERAYHLLQERASHIAEQTTRTAFLNQVPAHREIMLQYEASEDLPPP